MSSQKEYNLEPSVYSWQRKLRKWMRARSSKQERNNRKNHTTNMKRLNKFGSVAAVGIALAASAQAQVTSYTPGDLLLGFTDGNAAHSDLVLDLGPISSLPTGTLPLSTLGFTSAGLLSELTTLYGPNPLSVVKFGVVGATFANSTTYSTYGTVPHGNPTAPSFGAAGTLNSAVATVGGNPATGGIGDGSVPGVNNAQAYAANLTSGFSWTENIQGSSSSWGLNATLPGYSASASAATTLDLYGRVNSPTVTLLDTITLGTDGSVTVAPAAVPEPAMYGLLSGLGLLIVAVRRQLLAKS
jgi:hypothetical protein